MTCIKSTYEPFRVNLEDNLITVDISAVDYTHQTLPTQMKT